MVIKILKKNYTLIFLYFELSRDSNIGSKRPIIVALIQFIEVESAIPFSDSISAL